MAGLCYVENLVDAALIAQRHDGAPGQAFNVSDGLDVTWKEFTDGLAEARSGGQIFGEDRIASIIRRDPGQDATSR